MLSYIKRAARPPVTNLKDEKLQKFQSGDDYVVIAKINPQDEHIKSAYKTLASQYEDRLSFGLMETSSATMVSCFNNKDSQQFTLSDFTAIDALPNLIEGCLAPVIGEFTRANEMKYLQVSYRAASCLQ